MKTLTIMYHIICILAVTTTVYSLDSVRLRKFSDDLMKCSEKLGASTTSLTAEVLVCAVEKDGKLLDDNGEYIRDAAVQDLEDFISDLSVLKRAREMLTKCFNDGDQSGFTGREQTMKIATCFVPMVLFFNKPH
ncbi:PREDICTED: uncharacterized protein LOC106751227 [Dinoponera quadriceps]|uniref:Uncharacterized protein LOC106751227 n=1 Tax=Dinoponera quadriceps TaxID=609295 RepID=A0A6P3Y907_DINQU|nr:PREDICTED: uncharacterized protein LOC106751227 [Dinoponera quadriceps]